jgi:hypothetical protein
VGTETRGFASMDPAKRRAIASQAGHAAHQKGVAHKWNAEEARDAARKGHLARRRTSTEPVAEAGGGNDVVLPMAASGRQNRERS